jgi:ABC-type thiamine transport system ATPase subunit
MGDSNHGSKTSGADEFIRKMQLGYNTEIQEGGKSLSGGQRQRIKLDSCEQYLRAHFLEKGSYLVKQRRFDLLMNVCLFY